MIVDSKCAGSMVLSGLPESRSTFVISFLDQKAEPVVSIAAPRATKAKCTRSTYGWPRFLLILALKPRLHFVPDLRTLSVPDARFNQLRELQRL